VYKLIKVDNKHLDLAEIMKNESEKEVIKSKEKLNKKCKTFLIENDKCVSPYSYNKSKMNAKSDK